MVAAGEPVGIQVTTRDHAGKAVRALVRVTLDQDAWNPLERRYTRAARPLAEAQVTTDSTGRGFVPLRAGRSGDLEIRAQSEDARGNLVTAETSVWVWDAMVAEYAYRYSSLEVLADRERYAPGDTATIVINTDVRDATALAALEGRDVEDLRVVALRGNTGIVRFPIRPEYAPNAFVTVHVRKAKEVRARTLELPVAAARHDLAITLSPDKAEYRPGETANVALRTADAKGAPVPAELSLGVVDEAIYSLRADATPDPHDVFYGRRPDWVTTVVSFPTLYYGGADKGGREEVRKDFRDVAYWEPSVLTDAAGKASVSFRWPDNLTTWRLTSRGATAATLVGKAVEKTLVSKPLVARLSGPRAFVVGDRATLISGVTNRSREPLTGVEERLEATGPATIEGKTSRRSDLPAGGESRGEWPVTVREIPARADTIPQATFTFHARAKTDADALETGIPVLPRAVPLRPHGAGVLAGPDAAIAVALPGDLVRPGSSVALELSPSIAAMALGARDYLAEYPWGCTEQTANALRATLDLSMVEKKLGVSFPGPRDSSAAVRRGIERLVSLQHGDGGWGWWSEGETDPYLTALALDALARVAFAGRASPEADGALERGAMAMLQLLDQVRTEDGEAYALMHLGGLLSLPNAGQRFADLKSRLEDLALATSSARDKLGDAGLALCALGHMNLGRMDEARTLVQALAARAIQDGAGVHWRESADTWFDADVEATAYALSALLTASPADPRALGALRWLAAQRRADHWRSTRTTAPVAIALGDWLLAHPEEAKPAYRLEARWNGAPLLERAVGAADVFGRGARVVIPGSRLVPGENRLALAKSGAGSVFWSWEARALVPSPGPSTAAEKRLSLTREYLHAERTADLRGRPRWLTTPLEPGQAFSSGEAVLVRLTIHAAGALDHLILEDPRPAGYEVDDLVPEGTEHPWDLHAEARDTRSVFFLSRLDEGDTVLEYLVRPETAGTLIALPASLSAMYDPDLVVRSGEGTAVVSGGPSR
ncbi:MAG TPA: alpha-2-macroglobulin family protein [Terriglobales bacterium]|nr:alpha-2-macroglobulin family protein [Terriglobales bacterium]